MKTYSLLNPLSIVKSSRKITWVVAVFIIFICMALLKPSPNPVREKVDNYYLERIKIFQKELIILKESCQQKKSFQLLKQQFISSRLAYKRMEVLCGYFNGFEAKLLNGPALFRSEEESPDLVIPPQGFQAIEEMLYGKWDVGSYTKLTRLIAGMQQALNRIENETDRIYKFRDELVCESLRAAILRLTTLGITGFDSPIALQSLPEAKASIEGIKNILYFFKEETDKKNLPTFSGLISLLDTTSSWINNHNDFNEFDRLFFIRQFINPIYKELLTTRLMMGIAIPQGRNPINFSAASFFQPDFFNINFYSPGPEYWINDKRVVLGRKLFADPILSGNKNRSCASCHQPGKAFTDGLKTPFALDNTSSLIRNTPTLWNSALQTKQFSDSRTDILENQLDEVVHNEKEMKGSLKESVLTLRNSPVYLKLFQDAYADEKIPISSFNIANAISSYIRSLISLNSRFDQYMRGDESKMTAAEKNGFNLFAGKAKCATCHYIPLFNGLVPPEFTETESEILGVPQTNSKKNISLDTDLGKYDFTKAGIHKHSFKTPTLRNIELTAPYMHNGVFNTLEQVMKFYNNGGGGGLNIAPDNQTLPADKLNLSKKEIAAIIAFMKTLTDTVYNNPNYLKH